MHISPIKRLDSLSNVLKSFNITSFQSLKQFVESIVRRKRYVSRLTSRQRGRRGTSSTGNRQWLFGNGLSDVGWNRVGSGLELGGFWLFITWIKAKKKREKPKFPLILGQTLNFPRKTPVSILFLLILFRRANDSNAVSTWPVLLSKLFSLTRNRFKERHSKHLTELVPTIRGKTGSVTNNKDFVLS